MKVILALIFIVFMSITSKGQDTICYKSKWQLKPCVGLNIPITNLLNNDKITDDLIDFDNQSTYWQVLSITCFFKKHWGVEFNYQAGNSNRISKKSTHFKQEIAQKYEKQYYVTSSTGADTDLNSSIAGKIETGYIGLIYRYEQQKFILYPKFSIGVVSFSKNWGRAYLKEKNTNRELEIIYKPDKVPQDNFTTALSTSIGYKFSKRFFVIADFISSYYRAEMQFIETITDLNTSNKTITNHDYKKNIFYFTAGVGLIIVIK
jgi:hypothetical protein